MCVAFFLFILHFPPMHGGSNKSLNGAEKVVSTKKKKVHPSKRWHMVHMEPHTLRSLVCMQGWKNPRQYCSFSLWKYCTSPVRAYSFLYPSVPGGADEKRDLLPLLCLALPAPIVGPSSPCSNPSLPNAYPPSGGICISTAYVKCVAACSGQQEPYSALETKKRTHRTHSWLGVSFSTPTHTHWSTRISGFARMRGKKVLSAHAHTHAHKQRAP